MHYVMLGMCCGTKLLLGNACNMVMSLCCCVVAEAG